MTSTGQSFPERFAAAVSLRQRGISVEYLLAAGFGNPENEIRRQQAIEKHFARHPGTPAPSE